MNTKLVNLGCGGRFSKDWINVDFGSDSPDVICANLLLGVPLEDESSDLVYHSHVLEHFDRADGERFIAECYRILKPGGLIRIAVPDLEMLARSYLAQLENTKVDVSGADESYEWSVIELLDQVKRHATGGEYAKYFQRDDEMGIEFALSRSGNEGRRLLASFQRSKQPIIGIRNRIKAILLSFRSSLEKKLKFYKLYRLGKFRLSGEVHLQMYDSYSLAKLLKKVGFIEPNRVTAFESRFADWNTYSFLDVDDGDVRKPDSLFMEAKKPNRS